jgi:hypothetical protein
MGQRSTTHVANQFHEDIFIKVDGDRQYVTLQSINVSAVGNIKGVEIEGSIESTTEYGWQYANKNGYTRIAPSDFLGFNPDSNRSVVYITILTQSGRIVCHCYPLTEDFSVIVNKEGYVKETEHGHIWVEKH